MTTDQMMNEIREANLGYLMLAQGMIRADREEAIVRLGISEQAAEMVGNLTSAQLRKIASGNMLLCRMRVDDDLVWELLTNQTVGKVDNDATTRLHASILMAGKFAEAM